jgi:hypothetical protein
MGARNRVGIGMSYGHARPERQLSTYSVSIPHRMLKNSSTVYSEKDNNSDNVRTKDDTREHPSFGALDSGGYKATSSILAAQ